MASIADIEATIHDSGSLDVAENIRARSNVRCRIDTEKIEKRLKLKLGIQYLSLSCRLKQIQVAINGRELIPFGTYNQRVRRTDAKRSI